MTSTRLQRLFAMMLCLTPGGAAWAAPDPQTVRPQPPHIARPAAPAALAARIRELGAGFDGRVGIAVQSIDGGWRTGWKADELYPQQSCSKFWV